MKRNAKRPFGILLGLVMALVVMAGTSLTLYADDPYASLKNTMTVVKFDDKKWYLIDYDSSTVTLLSWGCVAVSEFGSSNVYSGSKVETVVNNWYTDNISAAEKKAVNGNGMFLLTTEQAKAITNVDVRKTSLPQGAIYFVWWLCSPAIEVTEYAACVNAENGQVLDEYGSSVGEGDLAGVRPAIKLNLSSVVFSPDTNTFSVTATVKLTGGANATASGADVNQEVAAGTAMKTVTYTAKNGYAFPETSDSYGTKNGIKVTRISDSVVQVSGTPTANTTITVPDAIVVPATVTKAPTAMDLTYTGKAQTLVTAGTVSSGTMQYALGKDAATAPTSDWSTSLPKATNAGTYYVWYKAVGDSHHIDTEPKSVKVVIAKATPRYTAPWGLTALTGQKLTDVKLPAGWSWVNSNEDVGEEGINPFKANFTPSDTNNYETVRNVDVSVKISPYTDGLIVDVDGVRVYDEEHPAMNDSLTVTQKDSKLNIKWTLVPGAEGYDVYASYSNKAYGKPVKSVNSPTTGITIKKLNGKKLDRSKIYKVYVAAYRTVNGQKETVKSIEAFIAGDKNAAYTNAKNIKLNKNCKVGVGKKARITASIVLQNKGKKILPKKYAPKFRYRSSDESIAIVKNGKIKGLKTGTCVIYVYAANGLCQKIVVTVG